jgi:hypothetical protein
VEEETFCAAASVGLASQTLFRRKRFKNERIELRKGDNSIISFHNEDLCLMLQEQAIK